MINPHMLKRIFDAVIQETESLEESLSEEEANNDIHIRNVVSKVNLLDDRQFLSLETIASSLGGMAKYQPRKFAAIVLRVKDSISTTTCLVFSTGKLVVVGALTWYHALYASQLYRTIIERVEVPYMDPETNQIVIQNLEGRTKFDNWGIWNIVASTRLAFRPDLMPFIDLMPDMATWDPEMFPGLKLLVWLRPKSECKCNSMKKNKSCGCNTTCVIFDTGRVNITGCKDFGDVNLANHRVRALLEDDEFHDNDKELPKHERFEARRQKVLNARMQFDILEEKPKQKRTKTESTHEADMRTIKRKYKNKKLKTVDESLHPFVNACLLGQVENVEFILGFDDSHVLEALEEMEKVSPEDRDEKVMRLLQREKNG